MKNLFFTIISVVTMISCGDGFDLSNVERDSIVINPDYITPNITAEECVVDKIISLSLPSKFTMLSCDKIVYVNNRIYILDKMHCKSILVFDEEGNYLHHLGERGRAKNEYINSPYNFSVDESNGDVFVYDMSLNRIMHFDKAGKFVGDDKLSKSFPEDFSLSKDGNYVFSYSNNENGEKNLLSIVGLSGEILKPLLKRNGMIDNSVMSLSGINFAQNNSVYLPEFSDSVFVIVNDSLKRIVRLDFMGKYISEKDLEKAKESTGYTGVYAHDGVQFVERYEETESLINVIYCNKKYQRNYIRNKTNNKFYNLSANPFTGMFSYNHYDIIDNHLVYFVNEENIILLNQGRDEPYWKDYYQNSLPEVQDIIDEKVKAPLLMFVRLK